MGAMCTGNKDLFIMDTRITTETSRKKVAIVHDFLLSFGGAERVLQSLIELYPEAPVYTLLAHPDVTDRYFSKCEIRESFLSKLPSFLKKRHRWLLPLYPAAVEAFDLRDFDVVLSSSGAWSKGVVTRLHTTHIAYVHSPMRYAWDENESYLFGLEFFAPFRFIGRMMLSYLRVWDKQAAERPDVLIANSDYTRRRIAKYYRLPSAVVYPPVGMEIGTGELSRANEKESVARIPLKNYFLIVSRLTEAKRIQVAIEAFNKSELPLLIVGTGSALKSLQKKAEKNIHFLGFQDDEQMPRLYREARALVHVAEEDFGLSIAESLTVGTPVIAFDHGGSLELIRPGVNGELFFAQTPEILSDGIRRFMEHEKAYDRDAMRRDMMRFSKTVFQEKMRNSVNGALNNQ